VFSSSLLYCNTKDSSLWNKYDDSSSSSTPPLSPNDNFEAAHQAEEDLYFPGFILLGTAADFFNDVEPCNNNWEWNIPFPEILNCTDNSDLMELIDYEL